MRKTTVYITIAIVLLALYFYNKTKTEIIAYDNTYFTIEKLTKHIKDIIHSKTYSIDNFNKLISAFLAVADELSFLLMASS